MKTLADLKRTLIIGKRFKMVYSSNGNRLVGKLREVVRIQSNGIYLIDPTLDNAQELREKGRGSWLDYPKATLLEITPKGFKIYNKGLRELTSLEKTIREGYEATRDRKQEEIDMMTDGSTSYWRQKRYYLQHNAIYLMGNETQRGMRFDYNTGKVWDDNVKGELSLEYEWVK